MPKRRKSVVGTTKCDETDTAAVLEAAEAPPPEPQAENQPPMPRGCHWSLSSQWQKDVRKLRRHLASTRKAFAKREVQWEKKRRCWESLEQAFIARYGESGWETQCLINKRVEHLMAMWSELWILEKLALEATREQWKSEVGMLELDRDQLKEQVAALREQISELCAGPGHN